jgi:hypothetical protein
VEFKEKKEKLDRQYRALLVELRPYRDANMAERLLLPLSRPPPPRSAPSELSQDD